MRAPHVILRALVLLAAVANHGSEAAGQADDRLVVARDYAKLVAGCGRRGTEPVSFFSAFGGLWPVPSNFVLVDAANNRIEYSDLAFPWDDVRKISTVFFGGRALLQRNWPGLFSRQDGTTTQRCGLQVTRHAYWEDFNAPVVVVSNDRDHLLLVGPITDAADAALECYASTARLRGRVCN